MKLIKKSVKRPLIYQRPRITENYTDLSKSGTQNWC